MWAEEQDGAELQDGPQHRDDLRDIQRAGQTAEEPLAGAPGGVGPTEQRPERGEGGGEAGGGLRTHVAEQPRDEVAPAPLLLLGAPEEVTQEAAAVLPREPARARAVARDGLLEGLAVLAAHGVARLAGFILQGVELDRAGDALEDLVDLLLGLLDEFVILSDNIDEGLADLARCCHVDQATGRRCLPAVDASSGDPDRAVNPSRQPRGRPRRTWRRPAPRAPPPTWRQPAAGSGRSRTACASARRGPRLPWRRAR